jgi:hypothetical protein
VLDAFLPWIARAAECASAAKKEYVRAGAVQNGIACESVGLATKVELNNSGAFSSTIVAQGRPACTATRCSPTGDLKTQAESTYGAQKSWPHDPYILDGEALGLVVVSI